MIINKTKQYLTLAVACTTLSVAAQANTKVNDSVVDVTTPDSELLKNIDTNTAFALKYPFTSLSVSITQPKQESITLAVEPMTTDDVIVLVNESEHKLTMTQRSALTAVADEAFSTSTIFVSDKG